MHERSAVTEGWIKFLINGCNFHGQNDKLDSKIEEKTN